MNVLCISLGCDKNLVDSEMMLGLLNQKGYSFTSDEQEADIILINTCCFIGDAKEESVNTILEMAELKKQGRLKALIVTGCLAQRYKQEILDEIPEVDGILGTAGIDEIAEVIDRALEGQHVSRFEPLDRLPRVEAKRFVTTGGHYAFLKIAEGCDKRCTYCIIPSLRGSYRSFPMEELVAEAGNLAEQGVKELILVAQETTLYGVDLYGRKSLPELLRRLAAVDGIQWIRIQYCYPEEIDDSLIQVMKEEDHEILCQFVDEMEFDRLGVFAYSAEEDTPAASFEYQVPQQLKEKRRDELMEIQQEVAFDKAERKVGSVVEVMIEGKVADENVFVGRTYMDAPDVDGLIFVYADAELMTGDFCRVRVTGAQDYDLIGELIE